MKVQDAKSKIEEVIAACGDSAILIFDLKIAVPPVYGLWPPAWPFLAKQTQFRGFWLRNGVCIGKRSQTKPILGGGESRA